MKKILGMGLRFGTILCSLIFCTSLCAQSTSPAPRWIPVKDISELQQGNVVIIGDMDLKHVVTIDGNNLTVSECSIVDEQLLLNENSDRLAEFIYNRVNKGNTTYPDRLSLCNDKMKKDGLLTFKAGDKVYISNLAINVNSNNVEDPTPGSNNPDSQHYILKFFESINGETNLSFQGASDNKYLRMFENGTGYSIEIKEKDGTIPIRLYRKDVFNLSIMNPKPLYEKNEIITLRMNVYPSSSPYSLGAYWYLIENVIDENPTIEYIYFQRDNGKYISKGNVEEVSITFPGYINGERKLWFVREYTLNADAADVLCFTFKENDEEYMPQLADGDHFTHPDENKKYKVGEKIEFNEAPGIEILYTLDDSNPAIENVKISRAEEQTEGENDNPVTYMHSVTPLTYQGSTLKVKYQAIGEGFKPSEIKTLLIQGDTSLIGDIEFNSSDSQTIYFDLLGRSVAMPTIPGIYIRKQGKNTEKIIIR